MQSRLLAVHLDPYVEELARRSLEHAGAAMDSVATASEALAYLPTRRYSVLAVNRDSIGELLNIIGLMIPRPVVIVIGEGRDTLDPELVTLTVPAAYDPHILVGVMLACVSPARFPLAPGAREGIGEVC